MKIKKEHQWLAMGLIAGLVVYHAIAFMVIYNEEPKAFNCDRAIVACNIPIGGDYIDTTPYERCDSCCPEDEQLPNNCDGKIIPTTAQEDYADALAFCQTYTPACPSDIVQQECLPVYGDFGLWTTCSCGVGLY